MSTRRPPVRAQTGPPIVLRFSLAATLAYVVVTFVAGLRAHSLALLSESGHNVSDFLALLLSFAAVYFQAAPGRRLEDLRLPARRRAGRVHQRRHAHRHLALDRRRGRAPAFEPRGRAAAAHDDRGRGRRGDERRDRRAACGAWPATSTCAAPFCTWPATRFPQPRSSPAARAFCSPAELDRPRSLAAHRRAHPLVEHRHRARNPEHPARRHAARLFARRDPLRHGSGRGRRQRPRPARLEPRLALARAGLPRDHRRHSAVGERLHPGQAQPSAPRALPDQPHHHPVRAHRLRGARGLRRAARSRWPQATSTTATRIRAWHSISGGAKVSIRL